MATHGACRAIDVAGIHCDLLPKERICNLERTRKGGGDLNLLKTGRVLRAVAAAVEMVKRF